MSRAVLIVIPTLNEAENLQPLVAAVLGTLPAAHILVVDDASSDGTGSIADALSQADARLHVLHRASRLGLGSAYRAGFAWALERGYERVFEMDADFSHDPRYLPAFQRALDEGADVVVGSRNVPGGTVMGWGLGRHLLSRGGSIYSRLLLDVPVRDLTTGFKGYTRAALERLDLGSMRSNGYAFQIETTYRAVRRGLRVVEVPIVFVDRRVGQSKMTRRDVWEAVRGPWFMRAADRRNRG